MGTVRQEVARIEENVANAYSAAAAKGASLPASETIANLASTINSINSQSDANNSLCNYRIDLSEVTCGGGCVQNNTPTPSQPSNIICNNGEIRFNKRDVPVGYIPLSYLEFTGTQWIDTGEKATENTCATGEFYINSGFSSGHVFGSYDSGKYFRIYMPATSVSTNVFGTATFTPAIYPADIEYNTKINIRLDKTGIYIGDKTYTYNSTPSAFAATSNIYLGRINAYSGNQNYLRGKVYSFSILQNNILTRNFIPAKRISDNALGFYETVNRQFYTNQGSGTFTSGQELHRIPDNLEILDKVYFTGSQYSHGGVGEPYSNIIKTSLNLNDLTSATRATDWMNVKIEIDAKVYNQNETHDYPVGNRSNLLFMDGATGLSSKTYGGSLAVCYSDNPSHQSQFYTYTYTDYAAYHSAINNEHRCLYTMNFSNSTVSVYDKEASDYLLNTGISVNKTYGEIAEANTTPLNVYIGGSIAGAYLNAAKMYLYSVKVTRLTDDVVLYYGVPAMDYNTGKCGLFDSVSGNFDIESDGTASLVPGDVINPIYNTIGTQEQIQDVVNNTSSVLNLLALDSTVIDTQKLKKGIINRQVGIKVLDGTETWEYTNQGTYGKSTFASTDAITDRDYTKRFAYCTHFQSTESTSDLTTNGKMFLGVSSQKINFCNTGCTTPADFANWLKTQHNAGTPVIILYPLTNDVDIQVTAQTQLQYTPLTQSAGSINNLPIDTYKKTVVNNINITGKLQNIERVNKNAFFGLFSVGYISGIFDWDDTAGNYSNVTGDLVFTNLKAVSVTQAFPFAFYKTKISSVSFPMLNSFYDTGNDYWNTTDSTFEKTFGASTITSATFGALVTIPQNATRCFYRTFEGCEYLTTISYPLLTTIDAIRAFSGTFRGNTALTTMTFPSLTTISTYYVFEYAWENCINLQSISFPALTTCGTYTFNSAFTNCMALTEIHFKASVQSQIENMSGYSSKWGASNATIYFDL